MPLSETYSLTYSRLMHIVLIAMLFLYYIIFFIIFLPNFASQIIWFTIVGALVMAGRAGLWWARGYVSCIGNSFFLCVATILIEMLSDVALIIWTLVNIILIIISFSINTFLLLLLLLAIECYLLYKLVPVALVMAMGTPESRNDLLLALSPVSSGSGAADAPPRPPPPKYTV